MISSKNIFYHELIGLELKVVDSSNPSLIGLCRSEERRVGKEC